MTNKVDIQKTKKKLLTPIHYNSQQIKQLDINRSNNKYPV